MVASQEAAILALFLKGVTVGVASRRPDDEHAACLEFQTVGWSVVTLASFSLSG